jgi:hypothetical protein
MAKQKKKPCNLTKKEWEFLLGVFDDHVNYENCSQATVEMLKEIHQKIFFMDYLIQQQEE